MTNQGVNFQLPSGGQFSAAVDGRWDVDLETRRKTRDGYLLP
jgi:hypothetical protein